MSKTIQEVSDLRFLSGGGGGEWLGDFFKKISFKHILTKNNSCTESMSRKKHIVLHEEKKYKPGLIHTSRGQRG